MVMCMVTLATQTYGQNASELRTIKVFRHVSNFIRALYPHDHGVIPGPNLIDITFDQTEFDRYDCSCENHAGMVQCLLHALVKRVEAGNTLSRLDLVECSNITENDVVELSKVVGQIEYPHTNLVGEICEDLEINH